MKSLSLDHLYAKLDKCILLVQSYTEINDLAFVIKACRMKPYSYMSNPTDNIVLYDWWFDEFGNSLKLNKKKVQIVYGDLSLDRGKIVCTDLYFGLSIDKICKLSKEIYLHIGKDEDLNEDLIFVTFLGLDNYFRSFAYIYGEWKVIPSLLFGLEDLKLINGNAGIKYFQKLPNKKNCPIPCVSGERWLSCLPAHKDFIESITRQHEAVSFLFK